MKKHVLLVALFVFLAGCLLYSACGGGGGGTTGPGNTSDYNRTGSMYMPTASSQALTYTVVRTTAWAGFWGNTESEWADTDDTTYRRETVTIGGVTFQGMKAVPERSNRYTYPVFQGTQFFGMDGGQWAGNPILVLPASLPDSGQTWDTGATMYYDSFNDGVVDTDAYFEPILTITGQIEGTETVTVPAGTYTDALKVRYTGTIQMDSPAGMASLGAAQATIWYVYGLGPVKGVGSTPLTGEVEVALSAVAD